MMLRIVGFGSFLFNITIYPFTRTVLNLVTAVCDCCTCFRLAFGVV